MHRATLLDAMVSLCSILKEQTDDRLSSEAESSDAESEHDEHGPATTPPNSDAAIQLEILKLLLKLQREQAAAQLAQQHHEREMKDKDLEMRRMEAAANEKLKREEFDVKRLKITQQTKRDQQPIVMLKRFAEALKGVMHHQPADPCGLPLYFDNPERVYKQFGVPTELQASLLIPYLNTRTQSMITRLSPGIWKITPN